MCCLVSESIQGTVGTEETRHEQNGTNGHLYMFARLWQFSFLSKDRLSYSPRIVFGIETSLSQDDLVNRGRR